MPDWVIASCAADMANCANRSMNASSFGVEGEFGIIAPHLRSILEANYAMRFVNAVDVSIPQRPLRREERKSSWFRPTALITPMPVITTRRISAGR